MLIPKNSLYAVYSVKKYKLSENSWQDIFSQVYPGHAQYGVKMFDPYQVIHNRNGKNFLFIKCVVHKLSTDV